MIYHFSVVLLTAVLAGTAPTANHAANISTEVKPPACDTSDPYPIYESVLNAALPLIVDVPYVEQRRATVVVRFVDGTSRERYAELRMSRDGQIVCLTRQPEQQPIHDQVTQILDMFPDATDAIICQHLKLRSEKITDSELPALRALMREFRRLTLPTTLSQSLSLDAPRYEVAIVAPMNRLHMTVFDSAGQSYPVVTWAKKLFKSLDDYASRQQRGQSAAQ